MALATGDHVAGGVRETARPGPARPARTAAVGRDGVRGLGTTGVVYLAWAVTFVGRLASSSPSTAGSSCPRRTWSTCSRGMSLLGFVAIGQTLVILCRLARPVGRLRDRLVEPGRRHDDGRRRRPRSCSARRRPSASPPLIGLVNGLIITKLRVNAFIATLGTGLMIKGYLDTRYKGPAGDVHAIVPAVRLHAGRRRPDLDDRDAARGGRWPRLVRCARPARLPHVRRRRQRRGGPALRRPHRPHAHRRPRAVLAVPPGVAGLLLAARSAPATPAVVHDGGYDLDSIAAVVLGGTAAARRARRRRRHGRPASWILAVLDTVFDALAGRPVLQGRGARRDHHRRRRPLRPPPDRPPVARQRFTKAAAER